MFLTRNKDIKYKGEILVKEYEARPEVSHMLVINKIQVLAAAYKTGDIVLWDILLQDQRKIYEDWKTVLF